MASTRADETATETPAPGRPADTDEAAQKGAEGIQDDEQQHEKGQRMSRPDGPDKASNQRAQAPADRAEAAGDGAVGTIEAPADAPDAPDAPAKTERTTKDARTGKDAQPAAAVTAPAGTDAPAEGTTDASDASDATAPAEDAVPVSADDPQALGKEETAPKAPSGVGQGAGAVVSAALGVVSLTGGWLGTVAGARESLIGQLQTSQGASVAQQIQQVYGDQWHAIAVVGGAFALLALVVGVAVLARPAFGEPGEPQAPWIKSVSWAGVVLGVIGLLLAVLKFSDAVLGLPSVHS